MESICYENQPSMLNVEDAQEVAVLNSEKTMMNSTNGVSGNYQL